MRAVRPPRPSPLGRGSIVSRLTTNRSAPGSHQRGRGVSLSLGRGWGEGERVVLEPQPLIRNRNRRIPGPLTAGEGTR